MDNSNATQNDRLWRRFSPARKLVIGLPPIAIALTLAASVAVLDDAGAEYGDVVMNEFSDDAGMRPVVFPHWFHRIRFKCKVCHGDLGFAFQAGGNQINMLKIIDGEYCGACHDGNVAWSIENCDLCHSGIPNTPTHVHESTLEKLVAPARTQSEETNASTTPSSGEQE